MDDTTSFNHDAPSSILNLASHTSTNISPLEQEVLDEYTRLLNNMNQLSSTLQDLASGPMTLEIAEGLRLLERKIASVYTLMKASVYSIVLQNKLEGDEDGTGFGDGEGSLVKDFVGRLSPMKGEWCFKNCRPRPSPWFSEHDEHNDYTFCTQRQMGPIEGFLNLQEKEHDKLPKEERATRRQ